MSFHAVIQFSPSKSPKSASVPSPVRQKRPSPEKQSLAYIAVVTPKRLSSAELSGSPTKKAKGNQEYESLLGSTESQEDLCQTKKIDLPYSLVDNGRATGPPNGDFSDLFKLFPAIRSVDILPPSLVFRVDNLPSKPWPLSVGGLPTHFTTSEHSDPFAKGSIGRGPKALTQINLKEVDFSYQVLRQALTEFENLKINFREMIWFGGFWKIIIKGSLQIQSLPSFIGSSPAFYRTESEEPEPDPAALRQRPPQGTNFDDSNYAINSDALLRPGIMVSSSLFTITKPDGSTQRTFNSTTSGILVADQLGELFITVASHGFENDGLVWHPDPRTGQVIGRIQRSIPGADISLVKLNTGLRYVNETFGSNNQPNGTRLKELTPTHPPHLRVYDQVNMNNPFSGSAEGVVMGLGAKVIVEGQQGYVMHQWHHFENGDQPVDGSCGSPVVTSKAGVVGLFRYKQVGSSVCIAVSALTLRENGYEICGGVQTFR